MSGIKTISKNRKARHDFFIEETYETGLVLKGTEVKSLRNGRVNLKDSFARIQNGEVYLHNLHIGEYENGNQFNHEPLRNRKLLLNKKEISKLLGLTQQQGYSLVPLSMYFKNGKAKLELAVAKGKKKYDKRESLKKKDAQREIEKNFREKQKI